MGGRVLAGRHARRVKTNKKMDTHIVEMNKKMDTLSKETKASIVQMNKNIEWLSRETKTNIGQLWTEIFKLMCAAAFVISTQGLFK